MDLIIGAGITGLSYAMFKGDNDYIIIEKESEIGGYCRTTKRNGFVWDFSGHFFHFQNPEIKDLILEKMIPIIAEQLNVNESEIKAESNFKDDLGADSLDLFELVMALEEEFGVEIPSEDLPSIVTVNDVVEYLKGKGVA